MADGLGKGFLLIKKQVKETKRLPEIRGPPSLLSDGLRVETLVPGGRVELPLSCENQILSLARLPVPPSGLDDGSRSRPASNTIAGGRQSGRCPLITACAKTLFRWHRLVPLL